MYTRSYRVTAPNTTSEIILAICTHHLNNTLQIKIVDV
jgi:hypothetical protein